MTNDSYEAGKRGSAPLPGGGLADNLAYARGDLERRGMEANMSGPEDPNAFQIITLMIIWGLAAWTSGAWVPWNKWGGWGYVALFLTWVVSVFISFQILKWLPDWLSGTIMGLLLGGCAATAGWIYGDLYWSAGSGLIIGCIAYLMYSNIE